MHPVADRNYQAAKSCGAGTVLLLAAALLSSACGQPANAPSADDSSSNPAAKPDFVYRLQGGGQTLSVFGKGNSEIAVAIDIKGSCDLSVSGTAVDDSEIGDMEIEVDSSGNGYPVNNFLLETADECLVEVRLEAGDRKLAWLRTADCELACPISDDAMLRVAEGR